MGKKDKLLEKLVNSRQTFDWMDLVTLLSQLGYEKQEMAGSRVRFSHPTRPMILLHKPHPQNYIKGSALKSVRDLLKGDKYDIS